MKKQLRAAVAAPFKTCRILLLSFTFFLVSVKSYAHHVETYIYSCVTPGQPMQIDANVVFADADTWYRWQYKDNSGVWTCFVNGVNVINGVNFTVSGATAQNVANDAPALNISSATSALENVLIRLLMRPGAEPCNAPAGTTYGGDDIGIYETKYLRLHVFGNAALCPPNSFLCEGNLLFNAQGYYGGFESKVFDPLTSTYTNNNFGPGIASSDFVFGSVGATYMDINNPFAMSGGFARDIAPHTGNFQLVVQGSADPAGRAWYKTVSLAANTAYAFSVFAARVDGSNPVITLKVNGITVQSTDMSVQPVGNWVRISGTFVSGAAGDAVISISDSQAGGVNNYTLDDICFRQCLNCASLPLHNLVLNASLTGSTVGLKWSAENEMNTSNFIVERSTDAVNFTSVTSRPASGQTNTLTNYQATDGIQAVAGASVLYYRIRAMDNDGRYSYSNVVAVRLNKKAGIQVWPSPFTDNLNISYNAAGAGKVNVSIVNTVGKVMASSSFSVSQGVNQLNLTNLSKLSPGIYFIRVTDQRTNENYIHKITK